MSGSVHGGGCEPNLTPMLDMVFQLITFFVLIFNCKQSELAAGVNLPIIGSARPIKILSDRVMVFNFKFEDAQKRTNPQLWVMGTMIPAEKIRAFVSGEAHASMLAQGVTDDDIKNGTELKDYIVIRADGKMPFQLIYSVIYACQENGFRQFSFKSGVQK